MRHENPAKSPQAPDADRLAAATARACQPLDHPLNHYGFVLTDIGAGRATFEMTVRADMLNAGGVCHGGILFLLADSALGYAANSYNVLTLASSCNIDFLAPVQLGDRLSATATEVNRARRAGLYDIRITNAAGTTVAVFRGRTIALDKTLVAGG